MPWLKKKWSVIPLSLILILAFGYIGINRTTDGFLKYYLWSMFSSNHGKGQYVQIDDIVIYYEIHGKGQPLLLLHGGLAFIESYYKIIPELAANFQVIAPESRGHGRTTDSDKPLSYRLMADDMRTLLEYLGIDNTSIVGWSDGGIIGLDLSMNHPDLVGKLVVIGSNYNYDGPTAEAKELTRTATPLSDELSDMREFYESISPHPDHWPYLFEKVIHMWQTQPQYSLMQLGTIQSPTLVIVGESDDIRIEHTQEMVKAIPKSKLLVVPEASHMVPLEKPDAISQEIINFLKSEEIR